MKRECGGLVHADNNWERGQYLMLDVGVNALDLRVRTAERCGIRSRRSGSRPPEEQKRIDEFIRQKTGGQWTPRGSN